MLRQDMWKHLTDANFSTAQHLQFVEPARDAPSFTSHSSLLGDFGSAERPAPLISQGSQGRPQGSFLSGQVSQAGEVSFISAVAASGTVVGTSFGTWNSDDPPTYADNSFAEKWGANTAGTAGGTVKYYFVTNSHWTATEESQMKACLALWAAVANVSFEETTTSSQAQIRFKRGTDHSAFTTDAVHSNTPHAGDVGQVCFGLPIRKRSRSTRGWPALGRWTASSRPSAATSSARSSTSLAMRWALDMPAPTTAT